eukprot:6076331-Alexandrium_andersonii.AAC.1
MVASNLASGSRANNICEEGPAKIYAGAAKTSQPAFSKLRAQEKPGAHLQHGSARRRCPTSL